MCVCVFVCVCVRAFVCVCVCVFGVCLCVCVSGPGPDRPPTDRPRSTDRATVRATGPDRKKGVGGMGVAPLNPPQQPLQRCRPGVSDNVPHCLQWPPAGEGRFSDPPAGAKCGVLRLPVGVPDHPPIRSPCAVILTKRSLLRARGVVFRKNPLRRPSKKLRVF